MFDGLDVEGEEGTESVTVARDAAGGVVGRIGKGRVGAELIFSPVAQAVIVSILILGADLEELAVGTAVERGGEVEGAAGAGDGAALIDPTGGGGRLAIALQAVDFAHLRWNAEDHIGARDLSVAYAEAVSRVARIGAGNGFHEVGAAIKVFIASGVQAPAIEDHLPNVAEAIRTALSGAGAVVIRGSQGTMAQQA